MQSESGVSASAHNPNGDASGLIQFMPATLTGLGFNDGDAAFRNLSAQDQLPWVQKYFAPHVSQGLGSAARLYQVTFLPATMNDGSDFSVVLCNNTDKFTAAYFANIVFDTAHKGSITVGDLQSAVVRNRHGARWAEILARFDGRATAPDGVIDLRTAEGVQAALTSLGFDTGGIDGLIGPHTVAALINFQTANGLSADGQFTPDVLAAIGTALDTAGTEHRG